jgi:hypothetical protein
MTSEAIAYAGTLTLILLAVTVFAYYFYPRLFKADAWWQVLLEVSPYLIAILFAWWLWPR